MTGDDPFDANRNKRRAKRMRVDELLTGPELDDAQKALLTEKLADPGYGNRVIGDTVTEAWQVPLSEGAVRNWRIRHRVGRDG